MTNMEKLRKTFDEIGVKYDTQDSTDNEDPCKFINIYEEQEENEIASSCSVETAFMFSENGEFEGFRIYF